MEFRKIAKTAVFLCLFSVVLSANALQGGKHGKHMRVKRSIEMDDDVMHPKKNSFAKESPRTGAAAADDDNGEISQVLDDNFMRRMEMDDFEMHGYLKLKKASARSLKGMDVYGMHPRPGVAAGVPSEDAMPDGVHPAIRNSDLFSVLGQDILEEIEFDDSVMHPGWVAKQPVRSSSKQRAPEPRMNERNMHPRPAKRGTKLGGLPEMEPLKNKEADIPTEIDQHFMEQIEMDDSSMHPVDIKGEFKKSSYYARKGRIVTQAHPKAPPQQQEDKEDVLKDTDEVLGYDDMRRIDLNDDSGMHDPIPREHSDMRGKSRRLLSLENGEGIGDVMKEAPAVDKSMKQMTMKSKGKFAGFSNPLHASCKITWSFGMNCSSVSKALNQQIAKWNGSESCNDGGEKCLYKLVSSNSTMLLATHETPVKHYVDDLSFQFTPKGSETCAVYGFSTSETWYAVLDKGTNYCNLHNLITGSGLDKTPSYKESTNDDICTQYSSSDCDVY